MIEYKVFGESILKISKEEGAYYTVVCLVLWLISIICRWWLFGCIVSGIGLLIAERFYNSLIKECGERNIEKIEGEKLDEESSIIEVSEDYIRTLCNRLKVPPEEIEGYIDEYIKVLENTTGYLPGIGNMLNE